MGQRYERTPAISSGDKYFRIPTGTVPSDGFRYIYSIVDFHSYPSCCLSVLAKNPHPAEFALTSKYVRTTMNCDMFIMTKARDWCRMDIKNREKIEKLYVKLYPILFEYARSSLSNDALAEEAVQDTFIIALQKPEALLGSPKPEGWLVNTLKFVIYNTVRRQATTTRILMDYYAVRLQDVSTEDPVDLDLVYGKLAESDDFKLLKEMALEDRSYLEMAEDRGITIVACRKRVQRAKEFLRTKIKF